MSQESDTPSRSLKVTQQLFHVTLAFFVYKLKYTVLEKPKNVPDIYENI